MRSLPLVLIAALIAACSGSDSDSAQTKHTVFDAQTRALDKAKQVEQIQQDAAAREKKAIDEQTQ